MKVVTIGMIACVALSLPLVASAQSGDAMYCKSLSDVWRAYNGGADPAASVANAITHCNSSPAASIPVLEKALTDDKIKLPKR